MTEFFQLFIITWEYENIRPIIEIENLTAGYDDYTVLENISFKVHQGEIFAILGGSGCGKSTLLKHMTGLMPPVSGKIEILNRDLVQASGRKRTDILKQIGVAFQSGALFGSMTVLENISLPLCEFTALDSSIIKDIALMKLEQVGLENSAFLMPGELSGGMKKRAALARAMALDPAIIFLDEPSAGLDPVTSAQLDILIKNLAADLGITFVIVTHELASINAISDRVIMVEKNTKSIIAEGTPEQMRNDSGNPYVYNFFNRIIDKGEK